MTAVLEIKDVKREFKQRGLPTVKVLKGANLTIEKGQMVALVAPSGSGKSTLLNIVGLLDKPTKGTIHFDGVNATNASDAVKTEIRGNKIGFVYQFHHLLPEFSCVENIMLPQLAQDVPEKKAREKAMKLLNAVKLADKANLKPTQISGGQAQRVGIARALANSPKLLLADEPTGNLDPKTSKDIFAVFKAVIKVNQMSALIVTHDFELAKQMDRIILLKDGILQQIDELPEH